MNLKKNNLVCQNCGIRGHYIKECTQPFNKFGNTSIKRLNLS